MFFGLFLCCEFSLISSFDVLKLFVDLFFLRVLEIFMLVQWFFWEGICVENPFLGLEITQISQQNLDLAKEHLELANMEDFHHFPPWFLQWYFQQCYFVPTVYARLTGKPGEEILRIQLWKLIETLTLSNKYCILNWKERDKESFFKKLKKNSVK